jgi:hypothetical protein
MGVLIELDENPDWEGPFPELEGWEPWEDPEGDERDTGGCAFCGSHHVMKRPEPFGNNPCCTPCFMQIIGGE